MEYESTPKRARRLTSGPTSRTTAAADTLSKKGVTSDDPRAQLLEAVVAVTGDLDLETVLGRVVAAACELVNARYGALGVIDEDGETLSAFIHHGVGEPTVEAIGRLPEGRGILGLLINEPTPLRLDDLSKHPLSFGFPPNHPPMHAFIGAPIRVRGEAFGNLYLTEKRDGSTFTAEDEALVVGLAAVAGVAITNARLYDDAQRREAWRTAVLDVSSTVLAGASTAEVRERVAEIGGQLVEGTSSALVEPHAEGLWVLASIGDGPPLGFLEQSDGPVYQALQTGKPVRVEDGPLLGPGGVWVPIYDGEETVAVLGVGRRTSFTAREEHLLASFGTQVSFAWTFDRAQEDLHRLSLIEERERIGRDLHDTVIQRLFATGLSLQAALRWSEDRPELFTRIDRAVDEIDRTVKEIRATIFALQSSAEVARGAREQVLEVVDQIGKMLARVPRVRFDGPIDSVLGPEVVGHLVPIVREALTNVAKHADAHDVEVELTVDRERLRLRVVDDGVGLDPEASAGFGLRNFSDRARVLGASFQIGPGPDGRGALVEFILPMSSTGVDRPEDRPAG